MRARKIAYVVGLTSSAFLLLTACRGLIGIEPLELDVLDGSTEAATDGSTPPPDGGGPPPLPDGGAGPNIAACAQKPRDACIVCCRTSPLDREWRQFQSVFGPGCSCGAPGAALCATECGGNHDFCPSSPTPPVPGQGCEQCVQRAIVENDQRCGSQIAACRNDPGCGAAMDCIRNCR